MTLGFKWRLILSLWLACALFATLTGVLSAYILLQNERRLVEEKLQNTATTLSSMGITDYTGLSGFEKLSQVIRSSLNLDQSSQTIQIYTKRGKLMLQKAPTQKQPFWIMFFPIEKPSFIDFSTLDKKIKVLITSYKGKNGKEYFLHISQEMPELSDVAKRTWFSMFVLFGIMCGLAFVVAHFLSVGLIKPVKVVAEHLKRLDLVNPSQGTILRLPAEGDYLADIVSGINFLSRRVQTMLYRLSRTSRYLAHELGNPLTILNGEANEVLQKRDASLNDYKRVIESSLEELARMQNVIETVTKIARVENTAYRPTLLNLCQWLPMQKQAFEKIVKREIKINLPREAVLVMLDADLLFRLLENLVRNIAKHTPSHADCAITVSRAPKAMISIEDNGPGMPKDIIELLCDGRNTKNGIGLSLCLEIANICHFELHFENKVTGGLRVSLLLE
ncbi:MAG: Sensor protein [uncultured bacterium]|nr:MAG: Sensor protein [uncultured bacterium]